MIPDTADQTATDACLARFAAVAGVVLMLGAIAGDALFAGRPTNAGMATVVAGGWIAAAAAGVLSARGGDHGERP